MGLYFATLTNDEINELLDKDEKLDTVLSWANVRKLYRVLAERDDEYAGYPMPVEHSRLVLEPRFAKAHPEMNNLRLELEESSNGGSPKPEPAIDNDDLADTELVNVFVNPKIGVEHLVIKTKAGRASVRTVPGKFALRAMLELNTMATCMQGHDISIELRALKYLKTLITPHMFRAYVLAGSFVEHSKRSGVTYMFRKLRPTLAMKNKLDTKGLELLAALCLHPMGYYSNTWAGVMCPTDDVIAHLIMMRGDEHKFWAKANHHRFNEPEAGL